VKNSDTAPSEIKQKHDEFINITLNILKCEFR